MIKKFDNTHAPVARYDFEGNLSDSSGNGFDLTTVGTPIYRHVFENVLGIVSGFPLLRSSSDAALRIFGDITVQALCILRATPSGAYVASFDASGETEATNYAWSLQIGSHMNLAFFTESGAGVNGFYTTAQTNMGLPAFGVPFHIAGRRKDGVIQLFLNGLPFGPPSPAPLTTPTGATTSVLRVNGSGTGLPELLGLKICASALTDNEIREEYNRTLGDEFGELREQVKSLVVGALTDDGATVAVKLTYDSDDVALAIGHPAETTVTPSTATTNGVAKFTLTGLDPDTLYTVAVESHGEPCAGPVGSFRTAPSGPASFLFAFAGDAVNGSNSAVFTEILEKDPLFFVHLGDMHYSNISTNSPELFDAAIDEILSAPNQAELYRTRGLVGVWDDHDYGANNSNGSSASKPAACATYRARWPHYPLAESDSIYHTFKIGRVRFIVTDQRSAAGANGLTDNSSKSMLGTAQKTWFKDLIQNSTDELIVWVCPRTFGAVPTALADHWGGFTTERTELADHIKTYAPGRVVVLSADMHAAGMDDGTNHDFATGGGCPLPTFQAAPLDTPTQGAYGGGTYSEGGLFTNNGQFGTMEVDDTGGSTIGVTWRLYDSSGTLLTSHTFTVTL
jgi:hypothetical protein